MVDAALRSGNSREAVMELIQAQTAELQAQARANEACAREFAAPRVQHHRGQRNYDSAKASPPSSNQGADSDDDRVVRRLSRATGRMELHEYKLPRKGRANKPHNGKGKKRFTAASNDSSEADSEEENDNDILLGAARRIGTHACDRRKAGRLVVRMWVCTFLCGYAPS